MFILHNASKICWLVSQRLCCVSVVQSYKLHTTRVTLSFNTGLLCVIPNITRVFCGLTVTLNLNLLASAPSLSSLLCNMRRIKPRRYKQTGTLDPPPRLAVCHLFYFQSPSQVFRSNAEHTRMNPCARVSRRCFSSVGRHPLILEQNKAIKQPERDLIPENAEQPHPASSYNRTKDSEHHTTGVSPLLLGAYCVGVRLHSPELRRDHGHLARPKFTPAGAASAPPAQCASTKEEEK